MADFARFSRRDLESRFRRLGERFRSLALVGVPAAGLAWAGACACPEYDEQVRLIRNPDAETKRLIELCRADRTMCTALCDHLANGPADAFTSYRAPFRGSCAVLEDRGEYLRVSMTRPVECKGGRSHAGVRLRPVRQARTIVGHYLARMAQLEAASIPAFRQLARELAAHGAPAALIAAATRSAREEARHLRLTSALAARHGARAPRPAVADLPVRSLAALARENAVEGCVRESYAAMVATRQARLAADPLIRRAMAIIAPDEIRHASLARAIDEWAHTRLPDREVRAVDRARARAAARLRADLGRADLPASARAVLGLPAPREARRLLAALERACA